MSHHQDTIANKKNSPAFLLAQKSVKMRHSRGGGIATLCRCDLLPGRWQAPRWQGEQWLQLPPSLNHCAPLFTGASLLQGCRQVGLRSCQPAERDCHTLLPWQLLPTYLLLQPGQLDNRAMWCTALDKGCFGLCSSTSGASLKTAEEPMKGGIPGHRYLPIQASQVLPNPIAYHHNRSVTTDPVA